MSFWNNLKKPIVVLAPMADVTDPAYRKLIAQTAKPDVFWTEFVSADGLYHTRALKKIPDAENPLMRDLQFSELEHPIVAQLFSSNPEMMEYAAELVANLGFDGIDINMGCPDKSIEKQGAGAAMIKSPERAREIVEAARRGAARATQATNEKSATKNDEPIPVSVKTRIGYNHESIDEWISSILKSKPNLLTVHLRTRKEMSKGPAHWDLLPRVVALRNELSPNTLVFGNGDVTSLQDATEKVSTAGADGAMLGRAIFGNPWLFSDCVPEEISLEERLNALARLASYFEEMKPAKSFNIFKKHIKAFVTGFDNAAELRAKLMECENAEQIRSQIKNSTKLSN